MKIKKLSIFSLLTLMLVVSCKPTSESSVDVSSEAPSTLPSEEVSTSTSVTPTYQLTFDSKGGSDVAPIIAEAGEKINKPANPHLVGYTFINWYEDLNNKAEPYVFDTMPARDFTLYAAWQILSAEEIDEYHDELAALSKPNHLYIHYLRFENTVREYSAWDIWVWPDKKTGRIFDFVKQNGEIYVDEYGGAMIEVDLGHTYQDGGHDGSGNKTNEQVAFSPNEELTPRIGFLITYKDSRTKGTHWTSDGGDKFFKPEDASTHLINDAIHVFTVQENVRNFTFNFTGTVFDNPYLHDDGKNVSLQYNDVDSSGTPMPLSKTSPLFQEKGVGYQIMVGSFADSDGDGFGDIRGIYNSLDYLSDLNVEVLWLTPIQLSDSYHGYDTIDYFNIDPKFGSKTSPHLEDGKVTINSARRDYIDLITAAKARGMSVVMDLVLNHTSINNLLFQESLSLNPEFRAYYHWQNTKVNDNWYQYSNYNYYYYGKFASSMPEFNFDYQKTRDKIVEIMTYWINLGVEGFRIDAVKHVYMEEEITPAAGDKIIVDGDTAYNSNLTKNLHFFRELNAKLKAVNPNVFIVGENFDGHAYHVAPYYEGLDGMLNFHMYFDLGAAIRAGQDVEFPYQPAQLSGAIGNTSFSEAGLEYGGVWNYPGTLAAYNRYRSGNTATSGAAVDNNFTSNHDVNRAINHASGLTIINGSTKVRAEKQVTAYMAASLLLPGVSWIYYGDELGLASNMPSGSNANTPNIDRIYRQPMKWDTAGNDSRTTEYSFTGAQTFDVAWDEYNANLPGALEQGNSSSSLLSNIKKITKLKSETQALKEGSFEPLALNKYNSLERVFAFKRSDGHETYEVYINMSTHENLNINPSAGEVKLSINGATNRDLTQWSVLVIKVS